MVLRNDRTGRLNGQKCLLQHRNYLLKMSVNGASTIGCPVGEAINE